MSATDVPLADYDLAEVAKVVKALDRAIFKDGEYRKPWDSYLIRGITIEIVRPGGDELIGHAVLYDDWIGFRPKAP